jgi:hypothetical protein
MIPRTLMNRVPNSVVVMYQFPAGGEMFADAAVANFKRHGIDALVVPSVNERMEQVLKVYVPRF